MSKENEKFLKILLETFHVEAEERIETISNSLLELEKDVLPEKKEELIEATFREFHSLKGASRSVNLIDIEKICHSSESVFASLKKNEIEVTSELLDVLVKSVEFIKRLLNSRKAGTKDNLTSITKKYTNLLEEMSKGGIVEIEKEVAAIELIKKAVKTEDPSIVDSTIRIPVATLDSIMYQVEELRSIKLMEKHQSQELTNLCSDISIARKNMLKNKTKIRLVQNNLKKELISTSTKVTGNFKVILDLFEQYESRLKSLDTKLISVNTTGSNNLYSIETKIDNLTSDLKKLMMMPFSLLLKNFPMLVRDLSHDQGKKVKLTIEGDNIEVDRRILTELKDPLIHILRNCIDHGIETPENRKSKKKTTTGKICIGISQINSTTAEILISDDGAGINITQLRKLTDKIVTNNNINFEKLTDKELLPYIFSSGISTKQTVTNISGRGLGLAIVRDKVERLGGFITVKTTKDIGTTFKILLPFSLASIHGVEVLVDHQSYMIPNSNIDKVLAIHTDEILSIENLQAIDIDGKTVPLISMVDLLDVQQKKLVVQKGKKLPVIVLKNSEKRVAFLVDEIFGEQEVLIKNLGSQLPGVINILGATILGNGKIVPILNVSDILNFAEKFKASIPLKVENEKIDSKKNRDVLVVDDSITSRLMLKNILESAGYRVKTAVDGLDAYEQIALGKFDLIVSDVDMPRMSGFTLTEKIKSDKRFSEIPVVLVTSLESKKDRERGIDVGASAYVVKRSFDQSNLLDIIEKII